MCPDEGRSESRRTVDEWRQEASEVRQIQAISLHVDEHF